MRLPAWISVAAVLLTPAAALADDVQIESVVVNLVAEVEVPALEAGPLIELSARDGTRVQSGDLLARIDDRDAALDAVRTQIALEHALAQAENDVKLRLAKQALKLAELELKRAEDANRTLERVVSSVQIEKLQIEVETAQLEVEQAIKDLATAQRAVAAAKNELEIAQRGVERRRIVAPIEGVVVDGRRRLGEWVEPGATVLRIVRDDRLRAEGFVDVRLVTTPLVGQPAELVVALGDGGPRSVFRGTVTFVSPEVNPINFQVRIAAEFDNRDGRLRAGLPARMTVKTSRTVETP